MIDLTKRSIEFIKKNALLLLIPVAALVLSYGFYATTYSFHIDQLVTDYFNGPIQITQGRWTSTILHLITNALYRVPFWNTVLTCVLLFVGSLFWVVLIKKESNGKISDVALVIFMTVFVSSPIIAEHITYLIIQCAISHFITPIALYYFFEFDKTKKIPKLIIALLLFIYCADHEAFASVILLGFFVIWTIRYFCSDEKEHFIKRGFISLIKLIIILVVAIVIDMLLSKLLCLIASGSTEYWYTQNTTIYWLKDLGNGGSILNNFKDFIASILVWYFIGGTSIFAVTVLQIFTVAGLIISIAFAVKKKSFMPVFLFILLSLAAISLDIIIGRVIALRTEQALVIYIAFLALAVSQVLCKKKVINIITCVVLAFICLWQTQAIAERTVFNYERFEYEKNMLLDVTEDLVEYPTDQKTVVFIVTKENGEEVQILPKQFNKVSLSGNPIVRKYQNFMMKAWDKVLPKGIYSRFQTVTADLSTLKINNTKDVLRNIQMFPLRKSFITHCKFYRMFKGELYRLLEKMGYTYKVPTKAEYKKANDEYMIENDYDNRYVITEHDDMIVVQFMAVKY